MYAKLFTQIYDGTLCTKGPWQALVTFQQLLVLADLDGNVDMTVGAIARRTTVPIEIIEMGIACLLLPDPESRTPTEEGRRIVPLAENRKWGWRIVNYAQYRDMKKEEDRRAYHREYWRKHRSSTASTETQHTQPIQIQAKEASTVEKKKKAPTSPAVSASLLIADGFDDAVAVEFIAYKAQRKAPLTPRAWADHQNEARKAGWTPQEAAEKVMVRGWKGFDAKYVVDDPRRSFAAKPSETAWQRSQRETVEQMTGGLVSAKPPGSKTTTEGVVDVTPNLVG